MTVGTSSTKVMAAAPAATLTEVSRLVPSPPSANAWEYAENESRPL